MLTVQMSWRSFCVSILLLLCPSLLGGLLSRLFAVQKKSVDQYQSHSNGQRRISNIPSRPGIDRPKSKIHPNHVDDISQSRAINKIPQGPAKDQAQSHAQYLVIQGSAHVIVGNKDKIEREEFDFACPMCGSLAITQI